MSERLRDLPQWVVWRSETRDGKPTKIPYSPRTGRRASSTDPGTWGTVDEARASLSDNGAGDGIGFVFTGEDPFLGVDLDGCRDPETGGVEAWAREIVEDLGSYTEVSPSGRGLHVIVRAELPPGGNRRGQVEMYDRGRFFTVTGERWSDAPAAVEERQGEVRALHARLFPPEAAPSEDRSEGETAAAAPTDEEILDRATGAANGAKFSALWSGDWRGAGYGSRSEADLAICSMIAFWTGPDEGRIAELFARSGLARNKWDREDYRRRTIARALEGMSFYRPPASRRREGARREKTRREGAGGKRPTRFGTTDLGNSERFVADHGADVRYCHPWGRWLCWSGARWEPDAAGRVRRLAKETVRGIYAEAAAIEDDERRKALAKHAARSEAEPKIRAMIELAKSDLPVSPGELDADPYLLNVLNGTIDLRTGELTSHAREDLITKVAPVRYDPAAKAPAWEAFLERVLPDRELRGFVQRAAGYGATGDTSEQCMFMHVGLGANGKSTFQEILRTAFGDYAMRTPTEMLLAKRAGGVPNDVARLKGARFVAASETEEGRRLAESLVKDLTGQDTISARFMRAEWFDFRPTHKMHLSTNHRPEIRGTDDAIWRRIRVVPWTVTIPPAEQDRRLAGRLRDELPGVLAWVVRGCLEWQRGGLRPSDGVRRATREYRREMDVLAGFVADCCETGADLRAYAGDLYGAYRLWCEDTGERPETQTRFGRRLTEKGFENGGRGGDRGTTLRLGLALNGQWGARVGGETVHPLNGSKPVICSTSEGSDPKNHMNAHRNGSRGVMRKKGSNRSDRSGAPEESTVADPSPVDERRVRELMRKGFSERMARQEVAAKDHPLDCECEVCL